MAISFSSYKQKMNKSGQTTMASERRTPNEKQRRYLGVSVKLAAALVETKQPHLPPLPPQAQLTYDSLPPSASRRGGGLLGAGMVAVRRFTPSGRRGGGLLGASVTRGPPFWEESGRTIGLRRSKGEGGSVVACDAMQILLAWRRGGGRGFQRSPRNAAKK